MGGVGAADAQDSYPRSRVPGATCFHSLMEVDSARTGGHRRVAFADARLLRFLRGRSPGRGPQGDGGGADRRGRSRGMLLVARDDDGIPIGFAAVAWKWASMRGARVAHLEDLFVDPEARRGGIGAALIEECGRRAKHHGAPCLLWITALDNHRAQSVLRARRGSRRAVAGVRARAGVGGRAARRSRGTNTTGFGDA